ncbi:MAG: hypothetical protein DRJ65_05790 [Acidobacteria bacterium]|nr:MAG: hypothetical protein DRJ65_05790 [Acidobacteriota bacterium]
MRAEGHAKAEPTLGELKARISELESEASEISRIKRELLEQQSLLKKQNLKVIRKSLDLADIKRDFEDRTLDLEATRAELKGQNVKLVRKSIELADIVREFEDQHFALEISTRELEESRERFRNLVESSSDWVWEVDRKGVYTYSSPKVEDLLGFSADEVIGKTPFDFMLEEEIPELREVFSRAAENQEPIERLENTGLHKDGYHVILETSAVPIINSEGVLLGYRGIDRDITESKRLEAQIRQTQKMEAIGQLAGGVAHDFNNLLFPIIGYADLLLMKTPPDDPIYKDLRAIQKAALHGKDLTHQILAFSRRQVLRMEVIDLLNVLENFEETLRRTIRENIDLRISSRTHDTANIRADISQIEQILLNLALNAQDAQPHGGDLRLKVTTRSAQEVPADVSTEIPTEAFVVLEVSDSGCGMEPETLNRAFEPFFTTKGKDRGTGLGLATVYGIVKQHGGYITVRSKIPCGTSFFLYFPLATGTTRNNDEATEDSTSKGAGTILVVEDNESVRDVVCKILRTHGYTVHEATDGKDCLERVTDEGLSFDLLLTDVIMPRMNGKKLYENLAKDFPNLKALFMSGYPENVIATEGILDSATNFVHKPVSAKNLLSKVKSLLMENQ